jgi:hypothetical protein
MTPSEYKLARAQLVRDAHLSGQARIDAAAWARTAARHDAMKEAKQ